MKFERLKWILLTAALSIVLLVGLTTFDQTEARAGSSDFVVMINPGHGPSSTGTGANYSGIKESVLNEKVAEKLYNKLKAMGYSVYITNKMSQFPSIPGILNSPPAGGASQYSLNYELLSAINAPGSVSGSPFSGTPDVAITIHHNSAGAASTGYEIYYSTASNSNLLGRNASLMAQWGKDSTSVTQEYDFAQMLDSQMATQSDIGRRGAVRNIELYSDVSNSLVTYSKVPTILFEVGYMSNPAELAKLNSSTVQDMVAGKIAGAVQQYQAKYQETTPPTMQYVTPEKDSITKSGTFVARAFGVADPSGVKTVSFAVYNEKDGPSSYKFYSATNYNNVSTGLWAREINVNDFTTKSGRFIVNVYGSDNYDNWGYMGTTSFIAGIDNTPPATGGYSPAAGSVVKSNKFTVTATNVTDYSGVKSVSYAVYYNADGPAAYKLYNAAYVGNNSWQYTMDTSNFGGKAGRYTVNIWTEDLFGNRTCTLAASVIAGVDNTPPVMVASTPGSGTVYKQAKFVLGAQGVTDPVEVKRVYFAVYHESNPSAYKIYEGTNTSGNNWSCNVDIDAFGSLPGKYYANIYAVDKMDNAGCIGSNMVNVVNDGAPPELTGVSPASNTYTADKATLSANGVSDPFGVKSVIFAVYHDSDSPTNYKIYNGTNDGSGNWKTTFNVADFGSRGGKYNVNVWGTDKIGNYGFMGSTYINIDKTAPVLSSLTPAKDSIIKSGSFVVRAYGVSDTVGVKSVQFAVYNEKDGADSYKLYSAGDFNNLQAGLWACEISTNDFATKTGRFIVNAYGTDKNSNWGYLGSTVFIAGNDSSAPTMSYFSPGEGTIIKGSWFTMNAMGVTDTSGVKTVQFKVYYKKDGPGTAKTYNAEKTDYGWRYNVILSNFGNKSGQYTVEAVGEDLFGNKQTMGTVTVVAGEDTSPPTASSVYPAKGTVVNGKEFVVRAYGVSDQSDVKQVYYTIYNEAQGSGSYKTFNAANYGEGLWAAEIKSDSFSTITGTFTVNIWGTDYFNNTAWLGSTQVVIQDTSPPNQAQQILPAVNGTSEGNTFNLEASGVTDNFGVKSVGFAVYYELDGSAKYKWYDASKAGDSRWTCTVNTADFGYRTGRYAAIAYATDINGNQAQVGSTVFMQYTYGDTNIMGTPQATVQQMVNYYNSYTASKGWAFPAYYTSLGIDVNWLAQTFWDYSIAEGVRPEIAWAQMCHETGYLQFGNLVKVEQFNFAGLGATGATRPDGSKENGIYFPTIFDGVLAQIQHLKAYASTDPLNLPQADPRFNYIQRGCAPTVQGLSAKWASNSDYGNNLMLIINKIITTP